MTTIAWRRPVLVADTDAFVGRSRAFRTRKVGKTKDGWLWALCGNTELQEGWGAWNEVRHGEPPKWGPDAESTGIQIDPQGSISLWEGGGWIRVGVVEFAAWGSGREYALGAFVMGGSAHDAIGAAATFDAYTGSDVFGVSLTEPEPSAASPPMARAADEVEEEDGTLTREYAIPTGEPRDRGDGAAEQEDWRTEHGL